MNLKLFDIGDIYFEEPVNLQGYELISEIASLNKENG